MLVLLEHIFAECGCSAHEMRHHCIHLGKCKVRRFIIFEDITYIHFIMIFFKITHYILELHATALWFGLEPSILSYVEWQTLQNR